MEEKDPLLVKAVKTEHSRPKSWESFSISKKMLALFLAAGVVVLIFGGTFGLATTFMEVDKPQAEPLTEDSVISEEQYSRYGQFRHAAVATDNRDCASIGVKILAEMHGSAVDAAIATGICGGLQTMDSSGIGGGQFMVIYERPRDGSTKEFLAINARETAPSGATYDMYDQGASTKKGGLAIAVPGNIAGLYAAWQKFGRLPWKALLQPSIEMARNGIYVSSHLQHSIEDNKDDLYENPALREILFKGNGQPVQEGDYILNPRLANTLEKIAEEGSAVFYNGSLADDIVEEVKGFGGIITKEDLISYKPEFSKPYSSKIYSKNWRMYSNNAPSSGPILQFMIQLIDGFNLTQKDLNPDKASITYQRIVETLKFGYAQRTYLSDPNFRDLTKLMKNLSSKDFIDHIRSKITDDTTHDVSYYGPAGGVVTDAGTSHISVLAADGAAVSMTATINLGFGAKVMGYKTGILYNDEMDDFSLPEDENKWGLEPARANFVEGGKRPVSSMCPTIITDEHGEVQMVVGGSGGSKITTGVFNVLTHYLFLGMRLNRAVDKPRLHHQLQPNSIQYEEGFDQNILKSLQEKGHLLEPADTVATIQAIRFFCGDCVTRVCHLNCIIAVSDRRKGGVPDGY